jgi:GAF domain-containing protein
MTNTFGKPIIPDNETARLEALHRYAVLDGFPDVYFNEMATIVATTFGVPIALVSLVASEYVEFKGNHGMEGVNRTDRGMSLCSLAVLDDDPTIFEDARQEPCLLSNPLVAGEFGLEFYAGVPLTTPDGFNIGTVCIVDKKPRKMSEAEVMLLSRFASNIMEELKSRKLLRNNN